MKKFLTIMTVLAVLPMLAAACQAASFPDVPEDAWFSPHVQEAVDSGLMEGYPDGRFGSWDPINRAEFAKTLVDLKNSLQETWWEKHLVELIFALITLIGWISLGIFIYKVSERPIIIQQQQNSPSTPSPGIQKNSRLIAEQPEDEPTPKLQNDFQEDSNKKQERKTNWWL